MSESMRALILVDNLDAVKSKNLYQVKALPDYEFLFVSYEGTVAAEIQSDATSLRYPLPLLRRALFFFRLLWRNRARIHHVEVYTGNGSFVGLEFLLCKLLGLKIVIAERGPLLDYPSDRPLRKVVLRLLFRFADQVWLRERWMEGVLAKIVKRRTFFSFNAVDIPPVADVLRGSQREIDFLWVNSFKPWRHPARFCEAVCDERLRGSRVEVVGLLEPTHPDVRAQQERAQSLAGDRIRFHPFSDPAAFYRRARYFVLPADIVFLNFSLLEAMAHGVVPLIADVDGAREIVDHGVDGLLFEHTPGGLLQALLQAKELPLLSWEEMSLRARAKVRDRFSLAAWGAKMRELYRQVALS